MNAPLWKVRNVNYNILTSRYVVRCDGINHISLEVTLSGTFCCRQRNVSVGKSIRTPSSPRDIHSIEKNKMVCPVKADEYILGDQVSYSYLKANNYIKPFSGRTIGRLIGGIFGSRLWTERLQTIILAQSTRDTDSTEARYIRVGKFEVRVNTKSPLWNPVVPQSEPNMNTPVPHEEAQNDEEATQPQGSGVDIEGGDTGQAIRYIYHK